MTDPKITALKRASTAAEFKDAVDALPRVEGYFTVEIRDAILRKQHLITDASSADAVVPFVFEFSSVESKRNLLQTAENRDLIIDVLAPKITNDDLLAKLGEMIANIVQNQSSADLFSNRKSLSTVLDCFPRVKSAESAQWIVRPLYNICLFNPGANNILNDLPVANAYSAIIQEATNDDAVKWICSSLLKIFKDNELAQKLFGTVAFFDKFRTMEKYATSDRAKASFAITQQRCVYPLMFQSLCAASTTIEFTIAIDEFPRTLVCFTAEILRTVLQKQHLITDASSADAVVSFLRDFIAGSSKHNLHAAGEICDLFTDVLARKISGADSIRKLGAISKKLGEILT